MTLASQWSSATLAATLLCPALMALPGQGDAERINLTTAGLQTGGFANNPAASPDGRFVVFDSGADDIVPGDSNFSRDVFVRDRVSGVTTRVSVSSAGVQGNHHSEAAVITDDGRYVFFESRASNLVSGDSNGFADIFRHDRSTGITARVSVGPGGAQASGRSIECAATPDGQFVAFSSTATNLVASSTTNVADIFVRDLGTQTNKLVSLGSAGVLADANSWRPSISADGQTIAFDSSATNLVLGDANGHEDVFVHELASGQTTLVSVSTAGMQGNSYSHFASLSRDGRFVAFTSRTSSLVVPPEGNPYDDVYMHDRQTGETSLVSVNAIGNEGNFPSSTPSMSADGRFIAFQSWADNLLPGDTNSSFDIMVRDTVSQITHRVNLAPGGVESDNHSYEVAITPDGRYVVYESDATNLVPGDSNGKKDIFITDFLGQLGCPPPGLYCTSKTTSLAGCLPSIGFTGAPSLAAGSGFDVTAGPMPGGNPGLFIYTTSGHAAPPLSTPFGHLCLTPGAMFRIALQVGAGNSGVCDGLYTVDFNQYAATQTENPALVADAVVDIQLWYRDPPSAGTASLTNAGRFIMCP